MASDLFLSYSRKDTQRALILADSLRAAGVAVWLDQQAIEGATSWSKEIAAAILDCKAFAVLLSNYSIASPEVAREVAIASERKKPILPIDLDDVILPVELIYPLAGIQRLSATDQSGLIRALGKIGIIGVSAGPSLAVLSPLPADPLGRKTLAVLPFENLSHDAGDDWFAAGLTQELINVVSQIKSLRVKDRKSVVNYSTAGKPLIRIADELGVQFILEGTVRKYGQEIRATAELIDTRTDDHLWSNTFKGSIEDLFGIQESIALQIADALKLSLTLEEKSIVAKRLTTSTEAFEWYLRAEESMGISFGSEFYTNAILFLDKALKLDPRFTEALILRARTYNGMVTNVGLPLEYCDRARDSALQALLYYPHSARAFAELAQSYTLQGRHREATDAIERAITLDPDDYYVIYKRGIVRQMDRHPGALADFERSLDMRPDDSVIMMSAFSEAALSGDSDALSRLTNKHLPNLERYVLIHPEDIAVRGFYAGLLFNLGRKEESEVISSEILSIRPETEFAAMIQMVLLCGFGRAEDAVDVALAAPGLHVARRYVVGHFLDVLKQSPRYELVREHFDPTPSN